ncbi:cysteine proteinase [Delitschia confertaspora ATCC 74209]|uniref:Cysteine proteinase n=1 Tax=Delitschia confertaspora ATCC 74209 TaxID=1513339 RepID=A0A9P4MXD9_9PLEO|nr:cysteine proteinase [Delitschia confertaspora ATCC 74209]
MTSGFHPFKGKVSKHFGDSLSPEDAYLSYHDIRLTKLDVDCIKNDWLTDNAIAFWEEVLEHEELSKFPRSSISLLRPSMSFMLMQTPDPLTLKEALPDFSNKTHIFLPINDNRDVEHAEGGSHWSLLLVSIIDGVSFHYDSLSPSNDAEARSTSSKLSVLLGKPLRFIQIDDSPQQDNGSDCGVFVCLLMKHLLMKRLLTADASKKISMSMEGRQVDATLGRKEMLRTIEHFRKEAERRRSQSESPHRKGSTKSKSPPRIGDENEDLKSDTKSDILSEDKSIISNGSN